MAAVLGREKSWKATNSSFWQWGSHAIDIHLPHRDPAVVLSVGSARLGPIEDFSHG
jgi:hypothetical protein